MWILPIHCFFFLRQLNNPSYCKKIGNVDKAYLRSDGCTAQLSPFYFSSIGCFHIDNITEWQFQEITLSIIDGVRETIWSKVIIQVKSRRLSKKQLKNFQNLFQSCLQKSIHCIYQLIWCWKNPHTLKTCRNGIPSLIFLSYQEMLNCFSDETIKLVTKLYVVLLNRRETVTSVLIVEFTPSIILTKNDSSALHACNGITNLVLKKNVRLHGYSILF